MKSKFSILSVMIVTLFTFISCSSNDKDDEVGNTTNKEAKIFIGKWDGYYEWEFKEDGTCIYSASTGDYRGIWKYESDSKTLITDVSITGTDVWSWKIISLSQDMWVGEHLSGKKGTYTYKRIK